MRDTKYIISNFTFYDRTGIQAYLEKQAASGWLLEKADTFFWKFRRIEPRNLHFSVVYFPKADVYDPEPGEEEQTFREFCAHGGWIIAASSAQMQIFYSEQEHPMPIETDPVIELENIHKSMKKGMLPSYWILVVNCVLQLVVQGMSISDDISFFLSSNMRLFLVATWLVLFVLGICRLMFYYIWRRRAKAAAEREGIFIETRSMAAVELIVGWLVLAGLVAMIATLEDRRMAVVMGCSMIMAFIMIALLAAFRRILKYIGYDAATNKKASIIATIVLTIVLIGIVLPLITGAVLEKDRDDADEAADLYLAIQDLLPEEERDINTLVLTDQESFLLGYQRIYQVPHGSIMDPTLEYNLVEVKADFLYDRCLEELMSVPQYMADGRFQQIDSMPWGAEAAWQMFDGESLRQWYVLCYEDYILEIIPNWEITTAQMQTVGEIFE